MGCGASTVALPASQSTPSEQNSILNNNNNNKDSKVVANGKSPALPNGGQLRSFTGVYGAFRNNSVAPAPFSAQHNVSSAASGNKKHVSPVSSDDELTAMEQVILEQHRSSVRRGNLSLSSRPLSSIEESPLGLRDSSCTDEIAGHALSIGIAPNRISVATQTDKRSPASLVRLKSIRTQTDYDLFPEDELEVLLSKSDTRLFDISSSLYSSPIDGLSQDSRADIVVTGLKGGFAKRFNQSQRIIPSPVASFISSSVLVQNKRGSCDAIVQVKFICTFDQSIQTVLSLIAPSKSDEICSLHKHSSLDSSASISPTISPSPEPVVKSDQDIQQLHRPSSAHASSIVNGHQLEDRQDEPDTEMPERDKSSHDANEERAKEDTLSTSSGQSDRRSRHSHLSESDSRRGGDATIRTLAQGESAETLEGGEESINCLVQADETVCQMNGVNASSCEREATTEEADHCAAERVQSETNELDSSVNRKSSEINTNESPGEEVIIHSAETSARSREKSFHHADSQQCNKEPVDKCSSGHYVNQSPATVGEQVNFTKNISIERRDACVQAGSPNAPALPESGEEMEGSIFLTVPRPPACKKKQMIPSIQVFEQIDQRIMSECGQGAGAGAEEWWSCAPSDRPNDARHSIHSLSKYLCRDLGNDLFKVRAIYRWITCNITYDANIAEEKESVEHLLISKLANCTGYCKLFIEMCTALGISAVSVTGFAKAFNFRPGHWFQVGHDALHSWCAVCLFGSWRLVDVTWGAGFVDFSGNFVKKFSEFYFLPDPEELIWSHFPLKGPSSRYTSETWQLIDRPITLEEFNSLPKVTPYFFECNLKLRSKLGNEETLGCVEFRIQTEVKMQSHEPLRYKYKLYPTDQLENASMNHFVFCTLKEDRTVGSFTIVPPSEGRYCFKIFASPEREMLQGSTSLHLVAVFLLNCTRARKYSQPFPLNELPWGLTQAFYDFKLRLVSTNQTGPVIATWGGKRKVAIESPEILLISHQLFDSDGCELDVRSSILREETVNKDNSMRIAFTIAPPRIGTFKLSIFGMPKPKQKGKWRLPLLATFLIDCKLVKGTPADEDPPLSETVMRSSSSKIDFNSSTVSLPSPSTNPQPSTSN